MYKILANPVGHHESHLSFGVGFLLTTPYAFFLTISLIDFSGFRHTVERLGERDSRNYGQQLLLFLPQSESGRKAWEVTVAKVMLLNWHVHDYLHHLVRMEIYRQALREMLPKSTKTR